MRNYNLIILLLLFLAPALSAQERGIASYYSDSFQGRKTASGEKYDKNKMTGAHKTLPFGTIVKVTRVDDGRSVKIRINDLGPYISGRIVELSGKAGEALGLYEDGLAEVTVEVLGRSDNTPTLAESRPATNTSSLPPTPTLNVPSKSTTTKKSVPTNKPMTTDNKLVEKGPEQPKKYNKPVFEKPVVRERTTAKKSTASKKTSAGAFELEPASKFTTGKSYKIEVLEQANETVLYGVQVAAVKDIDGMMALVTSYQGKWFDDIYVNVETAADGKPIYKLVLGAFEDKEKAENYKRSMKKRKKMDGFVVELK